MELREMQIAFDAAVSNARKVGFVTITVDLK